MEKASPRSKGVTLNLNLPESIQIYSPGGRVNSVLIRGRRGTIVVDTQMTLEEGQGLKEKALQHARGGPILYVVNTHEHIDHIGSNQLFDVDIIATEAARIGVLATSRSSYPEAGFVPTPPTLTFKKELSIYLGDLTLLLKHTGGHCLGECIIYIPEVRTLITGDLVFRDRAPWVGNADIVKWIEVLSSLYGLNPEIVIPGHGEPTDKSVLIEQRMWLESFMDKVYAARKAGLDAKNTCAQVMKEMNLPEERKDVFLAAVQRLCLEN